MQILTSFAEELSSFADLIAMGRRCLDSKGRRSG